MRKAGREAGQTLGEYAVVVAGIAIVCVVAAVFIAAAVTGRFGSWRGGDEQPGSFTPPVPKSQLAWPTTIEECEDGGWKNFVQFEDEAACREYVESTSP
jgi:hypothetical protein